MAKTGTPLTRRRWLFYQGVTGGGMELHELPDLSDWRYIEVWTLEEVAMLWAGVDPANHVGMRIESLKGVLPAAQYKKAWISLRAVSEALCGGTLPFVEAWEANEDYNNNQWDEKVTHPKLPDQNSLIHHKTRVRQAAFLKWAESKKMPSYRQDISRRKTIVEMKIAAQPENVCAPVTTAVTEILELAAPDFRDPLNLTSPLELRAGAEIWETITTEGMHGKGKTVKTVAKEVLNKHPEFRAMSQAAKERVATVVNWEPKGGAPKTPGA